MSAFAKAADDVKKLRNKPDNDDMLEVYALFKQATVGDTNTEKPGRFDLAGNAKWNAWQAKKGMSKADAEAKYVALVEDLKKKYGF